MSPESHNEYEMSPESHNEYVMSPRITQWITMGTYNVSESYTNT